MAQAAMLTGLIVLWFMLTPSLDFVSAATGLATVVCAFVVGWRLMGSAPRRGRQKTKRRAIEPLWSAARIARAALSPWPALRPAFVKLKEREEGARVALAEIAAAGVGALVVEVEPDGLLLHTIDEDAIDAPALPAHAA